MFITYICSAELKIQYADTELYYKVETFKIDDIDYFKLSDLSKVLNGQIKELLLDDRLIFAIYKKEVIIGIESSFAHCLQKTNINGDEEFKYYNFYYPLKFIEGEYFLPTIFVTRTLPLMFPSHIGIYQDFVILKDGNESPINTIVIDPGHGGKDCGALGPNNLKEKNLTLQMAKRLKSKLETELGVNVLLTRQDDSYVPLRKRTVFANSNDADLFVSIHCNAAKNKKANGIEVYYLSEAKNNEARAAQALENEVVIKYEGKEALKKYDSGEMVISDLIQSAQLVESIRLAYKLQGNLISETKAKNRGVKSANFFVLRGAYMPSVLIETGFISNRKEANKISNYKYQNRIIDSIFYAIKSFKIQYDRDNSLE